MHSISFSCRWPCLGQAASGQLIAVSNPSLIKSSTYCFRHRVQKMHWHWAMVVICSTGYSPRQSLQDTSGSRARSQVGRYLAVVIAEQSLRSPEGRRGNVFRPGPDVLLCLCTLRQLCPQVRRPSGEGLRHQGSLQNWGMLGACQSQQSARCLGNKRRTQAVRAAGRRRAGYKAFLQAQRKGY